MFKELVFLDSYSFYADDPDLSTRNDLAGQVLCGWAFSLGVEIATLQHRLDFAIFALKSSGLVPR